MKENLLKLLACPKCHSLLDFNKKEQQLICHQDNFIYSIIDGIPVLLEDKSMPMSPVQMDKECNL